VKRDVMFERNFFALTNNIAPLPSCSCFFLVSKFCGKI